MQMYVDSWLPWKLKCSCSSILGRFLGEICCHGNQVLKTHSKSQLWRSTLSFGPFGVSYGLIHRNVSFL